MLRLTRIRVYPLKGAGGFDCPEVHTDAFGIPGDRRWMLVRPDGLFLSQRTHPRLALIRASPLADGPGGVGVTEASGPEAPVAFLLRAPGMDPFLLSASEASGGSMEVQVQRDRVEGRLVEAGTAWFSRFLGQDCRLVFSPPEFHRSVDPEYAPGHRTGFSDGYPLLLTTDESLQDLNKKLPRPTTMLRFRPNLVVGGGSPWEEDGWRTLEIGSALLELVKPCARCSVTTVDPGTGSRGREPLRTLAGFRGWNGKAYFGQNVVIVRNGSFRVGADVRIVEKGDARPPIC